MQVIARLKRSFVVIVGEENFETWNLKNCISLGMQFASGVMYGKDRVFLITFGLHMNYLPQVLTIRIQMASFVRIIKPRTKAVSFHNCQFE